MFKTSNHGEEACGHEEFSFPSDRLNAFWFGLSMLDYRYLEHLYVPSPKSPFILIGLHTLAFFFGKWTISCP